MTFRTPSLRVVQVDSDSPELTVRGLSVTDGFEALRDGLPSWTVGGCEYGGSIGHGSGYSRDLVVGPRSTGIYYASGLFVGAYVTNHEQSLECVYEE